MMNLYHSEKKKPRGGKNRLTTNSLSLAPTRQEL